MAYREFKYPAVLGQLGLTVAEERLFLGVAPVPLPPHLPVRLAEGMVVSQGSDNEKSRSEMVVAPLLLELRLMTDRGFGLFSGAELAVDVEAGLNGVCDFLLTRSPLLSLVTAPVLALVEAKDDNVRHGYGQCIAQMRAAQLFNGAGGRDLPVYGASTTGEVWKFFRLDENRVTIDDDRYTIEHADLIAGVLLHILGLKPVAPLGASA